MAHTLIFERLRSAARIATADTAQGIGPDCSQQSRRAFLSTLSTGAAGLGLSGCASIRMSPLPGAPRIGIIGGGLAGLHCAFRLNQQGVGADVIEAASRIGGRTFTLRGHFPDQQMAELGGEYIDTGCRNLIHLVRELGLRLDDLNAYDRKTNGDIYFLSGRKYFNAEIAEMYTPVAAHVAAAMERVEKDRDEFKRIDRMNIIEWLDTVPDVALPLRSLLKVAYKCEYGLEAEMQSAMNLLYCSRVPRSRTSACSESRTCDSAFAVGINQ